MLIEELSLKAARKLCSGYSNGYWCDGCPFIKCCLKAYLSSTDPGSSAIGKKEVPERIVQELKEKNLYW